MAACGSILDLWGDWMKCPECGAETHSCTDSAPPYKAYAYCDRCLERENITINFDRITASPEALAEALFDGFGVGCPADELPCDGESTCQQCWLDWLNSPVESED